MNHKQKKVKIIKPLHLMAIVSLAIFTVIGCLPGDGAATEYKPAGFFGGIWHGLLCWLSLIISVFNDNIRIYEIENSGWWYDLGYLLGISAIGSGGAFSFKLRYSNKH